MPVVNQKYTRSERGVHVSMCARLCVASDSVCVFVFVSASMLTSMSASVSGPVFLSLSLCASILPCVGVYVCVCISVSVFC